MCEQVAERASKGTNADPSALLSKQESVFFHFLGGEGGGGVGDPAKSAVQIFAIFKNPQAVIASEAVFPQVRASAVRRWWRHEAACDQG